MPAQAKRLSFMAINRMWSVKRGGKDGQRLAGARAEEGPAGAQQGPRLLAGGWGERKWAAPPVPKRKGPVGTGPPPLKPFPNPADNDLWLKGFSEDGASCPALNPGWRGWIEVSRLIGSTRARRKAAQPGLDENRQETESRTAWEVEAASLEGF